MTTSTTAHAQQLDEIESSISRLTGPRAAIDKLRRNVLKLAAAPRPTVRRAAHTRPKRSTVMSLCASLGSGSSGAIRYVLAQGGYCAETKIGGNCKRGDKGAWALQETTDLSGAIHECLQRCSGCKRCNYISVAPEHGDCSWFATCELKKLQSGVSGFVTLRADASSAPDDRTKALRLRRQREERQRATLSELSASFDALPQQAPRGDRQRRRDSPLVLALGVLSTPSEAERRSYIRQTLRSRGHAGLAYRFIIGMHGAEVAVAQRLQAEHKQHGDLALLPDARDGAKAYTSEKVLLWLRHARREYPRALFIGKADPDAFLVWMRLRRLLEAAHAARRGTQLLVGYLEWVSYLPAAGRFCGCCAFTRSHGEMLQLATGANFGRCTERRRDPAVAGPFPYPQGAFYALTPALVDWVNVKAGGLLRRLHGGQLSFRRSEEDLLVGYVSASAPNLTAHSWGRTVFHNLDDGINPDNYYLIERQCLAEHNVSLEQLTSGSKSDWGTAETLGPMSAVVHRVNTRAQWRRVWALATIWTRLSRRSGHPECFFPQEEMKGVRGSWNVEVDLE